LSLDFTTVVQCDCFGIGASREGVVRLVVFDFTTVVEKWLFTLLSVCLEVVRGFLDLKGVVRLVVCLFGSRERLSFCLEVVRGCCQLFRSGERLLYDCFSSESK